MVSFSENDSDLTLDWYFKSFEESQFELHVNFPLASSISREDEIVVKIKASQFDGSIEDITLSR